MEAIDHLDLVVSDLERSLRFYVELLRPLGYVEVGEIVGERGDRVVYVEQAPRGGSVSVRERQSEGPAYDRYAIGLHHLAFAAPSVHRPAERELAARIATLEQRLERLERRPAE